MKNIFYILITLITISCKNITQSNLPIQEIEITDSIANVNGQNTQTRTDTLTLKSKPFELNNMLCSWQHFFIIYDYGGLEITMKLYDYKTKKLLLEYEYRPKYEKDYDYKSVTYFDSINKRHFDDFNFDGFKDFAIYTFGSMPMTSGTVIKLFNNETKTFEDSELSAACVDEIDSINKILTTHDWTMQYVCYKNYHFDNNGKIKFIEDYTYPNDTAVVYYKKIINEKIVEQRTDTLKD